MEKYLHLLSRGDKIGLTLIRLSIAIVFMWIGLLKFVPYEADSITPFVANSPLMSFFYEHPEDYKQYLTHEGEYKPEARAWQTANNTYGFSNGLGVVEVIIALLVLANPVNRWLGLLGGLMAFTTPLVTLSFLITTPEAWVPALGDAHHGFPQHDRRFPPVQPDSGHGPQPSGHGRHAGRGVHERRCADACRLP